MAVAEVKGHLALDRKPAPIADIDPATSLFAERLREEFGTTAVFLRVPTYCEDDTDYEFTVVSSLFTGPWSGYRGNPLGERWYELGGQHPIRILCLSPQEFEAFRASTAVAQTLEGADRII